MTVMARTTFAFDANGNREPERDDWVIEDVGHIPEECLAEFIKARYSKAVTVYVSEDALTPMA